MPPRLVKVTPKSQYARASDFLSRLGIAKGPEKGLCCAAEGKGGPKGERVRRSRETGGGTTRSDFMNLKLRRRLFVGFALLERRASKVTRRNETRFLVTYVRHAPGCTSTVPCINARVQLRVETFECRILRAIMCDSCELRELHSAIDRL